MPDYSKLRCPVCKKPLEKHENLKCPACDINFPIKDGIPVMLTDLNSSDPEQDVSTEKQFYEAMFSDLKGLEDGHCIVYGYEPVYRAMEKLERGTVLEPGCGTGHYSVNFTKMGFDVTSVDLSINGLAAAKKRAEHEGQDILFLCGDIKRLPFEDNQFDTCFCSLILHHFVFLEHIIKELSRVTRKHFIAFEVNAYDLISYTRFNVLNPLFGLKNISKNQRALFPGQLGDRLKRNGFKEFEVSYLDSHEYLGKAPESLKAKVIQGYQKWMGILPERFSKNKFLLYARK